MVGLPDANFVAQFRNDQKSPIDKVRVKSISNSVYKAILGCSNFHYQFVRAYRFPHNENSNTP